MVLFWVGLVEAVAAAVVGTWLYVSLPASDALFGEVLWGVAVASLIAAAALGRERPEPVAAPATDPASPPALPAPNAEALPAPEPPLAAPDAALVPLLPEAVVHLHWEVVKSRWAWAAEEQRALRRRLEDTVAPDAGPDRPLRRLTDALLLEQGFSHLAAGEPPTFDPTPVAARWSEAAIAARLEELAAEETALRDDTGQWLALFGPEGDGRLKAAYAHHRHDRLAEAERRLEEVVLLQMGYRALQAARTPSTEGRPDA
jgi:hypothetical protein